MLIGNIFQQVYSMADAMVVGNYVGGDALAAVGTAGSALHFLLSVLIGLTTGASVVISQYYGAQDSDGLKRTVSTSMLFLVGLSLFISIVGFVGAEPFLRLLSTPESILQGAVTYLRINMVGTVSVMLYNMYTAYLRALGDAKSPLAILIFSTLLNIVLDIVFVGPLHMGVAGAAWATILAQTIAAVLCFVYAHTRVELLRITKWVFDTKLLGTILRYSVPAAVQMSVVSLAGLTIMRLVNSFGSAAVAGYTAATKIDQFATMPLSNISMAVSTFVGQNMGAGQEERAKKGLRSALLFMVAVGIAVTALAILFGDSLMAQFVDKADKQAAEIIKIGGQYLSVIASFYTLFSVFFAFNGFFRGAGDAVIVMALTITSLTIRSVSAHILVSRFAMGPEAVAWSIPIGWALCSLFAWFYYKKRFWAGKVAVMKKAGDDMPDKQEEPAG